MVTMEYLGVTGSGKNLKAAKEDAVIQIRQHLEAAHSPEFYSHNGSVLSVWAYPNGGAYTIIHKDTAEGRHYSSCQSSSLEDARQAGIRHLLTNERTIGDYKVATWAYSMIDWKQLVHDWKQNDAFQLAYAAAKTAGESDCHSWACHHAHEYKVV